MVPLSCKNLVQTQAQAAFLEKKISDAQDTLGESICFFRHTLEHHLLASEEHKAAENLALAEEARLSELQSKLGALDGDELAELLALVGTTNDEIAKVAEDAWKEYEDCCDEDRAKMYLEEFEKKLKNYKRQKVEIIGKGAVAILKIKFFQDYFCHNFDQCDLKNGIGFTQIIVLCLSTTAESSKACLDLLVEWISNDDIDNNLLLRALLFNDKGLIDKFRTDYSKNVNPPKT